MRKIVVLFVVAFCLLSTGMRAQHTFVHKQSSTYEWPEDSLVLKKLDQWRDLKFGVIFHWGLYAVPGIVESWALCSEDVDWISRYGHNNYQEFKDWYWNGLSKQFNPTEFEPAQWAEVTKQAGMKYMIFTTFVCSIVNTRIFPYPGVLLRSIRKRMLPSMYSKPSERKGL